MIDNTENANILTLGVAREEKELDLHSQFIDNMERALAP